MNLKLSRITWYKSLEITDILSQEKSMALRMEREGGGEGERRLINTDI